MTKKKQRPLKNPTATAAPAPEPITATQSRVIADRVEQMAEFAGWWLELLEAGEKIEGEEMQHALRFAFGMAREAVLLALPGAKGVLARLRDENEWLRAVAGMEASTT